MSFTSGIVAFAAPSPTLNAINDTSKVRKTIASSHISCSTSSSSVTSNVTTIEQQEPSKKFSYSRASPSVRWPNRKEPSDNQIQFPISPTTPKIDVFKDESSIEIEEMEPLKTNNETLEYSGRNSRGVAKKMTKLALKRAKDWRQRVQFLTDRILGLKSHEFVADVLDDRQVQMTPTDFCFLVKGIGKSNWQQALEVYEWLKDENALTCRARSFI